VGGVVCASGKRLSGLGFRGLGLDSVVRMARGDTGRCGSASAPAFGRVEPTHRDGTAMNGAPAFGLAVGRWCLGRRMLCAASPFVAFLRSPGRSVEVRTTIFFRRRRVLQSAGCVRLEPGLLPGGFAQEKGYVLGQCRCSRRGRGRSGRGFFSRASSTRCFAVWVRRCGNRLYS